MIDDDLRNLMPVEQKLSPQRKQQLKEHIMSDIETPVRPIERKRAKRRLVGGLVAASVLAASTATVAAFWLGGPDPQQSKQVVDKVPNPVAERYLDGWRPTLRSESVACIGTNSDKLTDDRETGTTSASEFPLADNLTAELLIKECTSGNDEARLQGGFDPAQASACVRDGDYLLAVVALEGLTCAETGDNVRPIRDSDLVKLNEMRAFEVSVLAIPQQCPTLEQATKWARKQVALRDEDLKVREVAGDPAGCFGGTTYWDLGQVIVEQTSFPEASSSENHNTDARSVESPAPAPTTPRASGSTGTNGD